MGKYATPIQMKNLKRLRNNDLRTKKQVDEDYEGRYYNWDVDFPHGHLSPYIHQQQL